MAKPSEQSMANKTDVAMVFDALYGEAQSVDELIPWDIGGPQPVVQQLVAYGAVHGEVLDPGTGPGYHAIHYASKGLSATGIDISPSAIEQAKRNAERAGVKVNFQVADATKLDGFEGRFDTVVDCSFYHLFGFGTGGEGETTQKHYVQALHRATKPGARLFMFELGCDNVNGMQWQGIPADNFERVLGACGWRLDYLGTATYLCHFGPQTVANMAQTAQMPGQEEWLKELQDRLNVLEPLLVNHRVHLPVWVVAATRLG